jgi:rod shape determining protein RodA
MRQNIRKNITSIDYVLVGVVIILFTIGMVSIYVATNVEGATQETINSYLSKQMIAFILGIIAIVAIQFLDYSFFADYWKWIYGLSIVFLLIIFIPGIGTSNFGTQGWINLGIFELQTSEIAKLGFILSFAKLLELRVNKLDKIFDLLIPIVFISVPVLLIAIQPDLGQALVILFIAAGMIFTAGLNMKYIYITIGSLLVGVPIVYNFFLQDYQKDRLLIFFYPELDPLGSGYHAIQSKITLASGQLFGKGIGAENTMTNLNYLPAQWTDFIYSVIGETFGFIGTVSVILLFVIFLFRILNDSKKSKDIYGSLVTIGVFCMFLFQIIENIGMTIGLMPITGITLPFISYGGSSLLINLIAVGLVLNIYMRRHQIVF